MKTVPRFTSARTAWCTTVDNVSFKPPVVVLTLKFVDLMGVSEEAAWEYGEAVRVMAASKKFRNINFVRLWDLLENPHRRFDQVNRENSKSYYLEHATSIRQKLFHRFGDAQFNASAAVTTSEDWAKTHATYLNVLARKAIDGRESIATQMMQRGKAYGSALTANFPDYVRLSIHDSGGQGKLSLALIPNPQEKGSIGLMPWRSVIAVDHDGSYRAVYPDQVLDTHEIIYKYGRPYFFRFKSDLYDWGNNLQIDVEHLYPCGIIVRPAKGSPSTRLIPLQKVRQLSNQFSPIIIRGFSDSLDKDKTKGLAYKTPMENDEQSLHLTQKITYDSRTCLRLAWEKGDLLVDNNDDVFKIQT